MGRRASRIGPRARFLKWPPTRVPIAELSMILPQAPPTLAAEQAGPEQAPTFQTLYDEYFPFVWRMLWRLGVSPESVADAAQDVFIVVNRRLTDLRGSDVAQSWLYGIVVRVAADYRRAQRRKGPTLPADSEQVADDATPDAHRNIECREAVALLDLLLEQLSPERREVLVLVELEQMSVPQIAELLGANVNTLYTRLRAARQDFEQALFRHRASQRRQP
jgi:RNA polymerase sigma-70 factor, ECF subfamily